MKKNNKKRKSILIIGIILVVIVLAVMIIQMGRNPKTQVFDVVAVEKADLSREISANGEIGSRDHEIITARVNGIIKKLIVKLGDRVKEGDVLCLVDDDKLKAQQQSALASVTNTQRTIKEALLTLRTAYTQAKTSYEQARRNFESISLSHSRGSASDEQLAVAADALEIAKQTMDSSRQKLNFREGRAVDDPQLKPFKSDDVIINEASEVKEVITNLNTINKSLADCEIRAGINGVITDLQVDLGSLIAPGSLICTIHNPALLEVTANIDEVDIGYIRVNQDVKIESDAFIGSTLAGKVSDIAPVIKRIGESRICSIKINFRDPTGKAKIGASCSVFITAEKRVNVPVIPIESFIQDKNKRYAFKAVKDKSQAANDVCKAVKTEIETGLMGIEKVEVTKGVSLGDEIIKNNLKDLKDGSIVSIKKAEPKL